MVLGIIGYRNHASKLLNICLGTRQFSKIFIFCHNDKISIKLNSENKEKKIRYTNDLNDLKLIKAVIISSPNHTHIKYLKFFLKRNVYIFCEKPPCINLKDFNFLKNLNKKFKDRIYFNHNFQVSSYKHYYNYPI